MFPAASVPSATVWSATDSRFPSMAVEGRAEIVRRSPRSVSRWGKRRRQRRRPPIATSPLRLRPRRVEGLPPVRLISSSTTTGKLNPHIYTVCSTMSAFVICDLEFSFDINSVRNLRRSRLLPPLIYPPRRPQLQTRFSQPLFPIPRPPPSPPLLQTARPPLLVSLLRCRAAIINRLHRRLRCGRSPPWLPPPSPSASR